MRGLQARAVARSPSIERNATAVLEFGPLVVIPSDHGWGDDTTGTRETALIPGWKRALAGFVCLDHPRASSAKPSPCAAAFR
jgi:hypothetical protein